ncbi:acetyl/propionyl/methylcrotonyl-CoA carboxylase subunit alpha [Boudabousia marimammalium]|uniref:biotin carboxylase n=1 Tax=Boudabousia marimammalium TaxID=156892 RepID=A0A1Q5PP41_9ACTO|nr:biotin carboxylase N-terminal domain-containing protein [Boudabousia marimammalium]OKL49279.1 hypothetical protein BM477_04655 [Boudabousia marimammalium]
MNYPTSVLVANRGEIAARIFRTARELGVRSIAVYADPDRGATWTKLADEAYSLPGTTAAQTYLNAEAILALAHTAEAAAVHPGYGFLSEEPDFADAIQAAGMIWLGPSAEAIRALGNKSAARALAEQLGVGVIPGTTQPVRTQAELIEFGEDAGFPILLKNPAGGGGRGILELADAAAVGTLWRDHGLDPDAQIPPTHPLRQYFAEKRLVGARHLETQCLRDQHGNFWLASTRDCSVQRRNQKLIEEAPAPALTAETEATLAEWSEALFTAVNYQGAGTCEFLIDADNRPYFLEVNPRLQVEHTVTEEVTGTDLVALQLAIAGGGDLTQLAPLADTPRGHSLQMRITSEDPARQLLPTAGTLTEIEWPKGPGIRIDAALAPNEEIPVAFDSMIAKIIVTAPTREQLIARARRALGELRIGGVPSCAPLYEQVLNSPEFTDPEGGKVHTRWLEEQHLVRLESQTVATAPVPPSTGSGGTGGAHPEWAAEFEIELDGQRRRLRLPQELLTQLGNGSTERAAPAQLRRRPRREGVAAATTNSNQVMSPMQATVVRVAVTEGDHVSAGELVIVVEAMKMEQPLAAPVNGTVTTITVGVGDSVSPYQLLVTINPDTEKDPS